MKQSGISFGTWLGIQLQERGWSQSDLARESGLTRQTIGDYLSDNADFPDDNALRQIALALKVPAEQIYRAAGVLRPKLDAG